MTERKPYVAPVVTKHKSIETAAALTYYYYWH